MRMIILIIMSVLLIPSSLAFTVQVDALNITHHISPYIYGLAENDPELNPTVVRWGGNPSTRYNWELGNAWNTAADYYFMNTNYNTAGNVFDRALQRHNEQQRETILTIPAIGYVAKDTKSKSKVIPSKCSSAANAQPLDTSYPVFARKPSPLQNTPDLTDGKVFIDEWLYHLKSNFSEAPKFIAIDNEMDIWGYTHRDVHPQCSSYDEIMSKFLEYSNMVKDILPESSVLGPVSCCWWFYWNSQSGNNDRKAHNNTDFLPWFLQEVRKHDLAAGKRTLDYLDIHFYLDDVSFDDSNSPSKQRRRINSTRSLWDPTYREESWLGIRTDITKQQPLPQYIQLIPRMKRLIAENYPGTKLAITEYNWGAENTIAGAIALADALGIYGRENLDIATYWRKPKPNTYAYSSFKLYTSYFNDNSLPCISVDYKNISCYASKNDNNDISIVMTNHDPNTDYALDLNLYNTSLNLTAAYQITEKNKNITLFDFEDVLPRYSIVLLQYKLSGCEDKETKPCGISDKSPCKLGIQTCINSVFGECIGAINPVSEVCNGIDDNCDGIIDDDCNISEPSDKTPVLEPIDEHTAEENQDCTPKWDCTTWGNCEEDIQRRKCLLENSCDKNKPREIKFCDETIEDFAEGYYDDIKININENIASGDITPEYYTPEPVLLGAAGQSLFLLLAVELFFVVLVFFAILYFILR